MGLLNSPDPRHQYLAREEYPTESCENSFGSAVNLRVQKLNSHPHFLVPPIGRHHLLEFSRRSLRRREMRGIQNDALTRHDDYAVIITSGDYSTSMKGCNADASNTLEV
jgi:hypothetical protein